MINVRYGFSFASERKDGVESGGQRLHKQFFRWIIYLYNKRTKMQ